MRKILMILAILLLCCVIYFAVINSTENINFYFINFKQNLNLTIYTFVILFAGIFIGATTVSQIYLSQKDKTNAYKRQLEKSSIEQTSTSSKVQVLEAKIQTLEKALKNALDKN